VQQQFDYYEKFLMPKRPIKILEIGAGEYPIVLKMLAASLNCTLQTDYLVLLDRKYKFDKFSPSTLNFKINGHIEKMPIDLEEFYLEQFFDLVVDPFCLHCANSLDQLEQFLHSLAKSLIDGGCLIGRAMVARSDDAPILHKKFQTFDQKTIETRLILSARHWENLFKKEFNIHLLQISQDELGTFSESEYDKVDDKKEDKNFCNSYHLLNYVLSKK